MYNLEAFLRLFQSGVVMDRRRFLGAFTALATTALLPAETKAQNIPPVGFPGGFPQRGYPEQGGRPAVVVVGEPQLTSTFIPAPNGDQFQLGLNLQYSAVQQWNPFARRFELYKANAGWVDRDQAAREMQSNRQAYDIIMNPGIIDTMLRSNARRDNIVRDWYTGEGLNTLRQVREGRKAFEDRTGDMPAWQSSPVSDFSIIAISGVAPMRKNGCVNPDTLRPTPCPR